MSAVWAERNHHDTSQHSLSVCRSSAHNLNHDLNYSGWDVLWWGPMCWKPHIHSGRTLGWNTFSELMRSSWTATMTHSSSYSAPLSYLIHCFKTIATHQVNSSKTRSAYVFIHARQRNNGWKNSDCEEWQFSFLPGLSSVTSWMVQQCAFIEWKMWSGPSKETSCTRRDLSTSGQSLQARCPTPDQEL